LKQSGGGGLTLTLLQNTSSSSNSSMSVGLGYSHSTQSGVDGAGNNFTDERDSLPVSFGMSNGSSERRWTNNASSIIGTESVDIDIDGKLSMTGSLIANIDEDGNVLDNLHVKAGSFEWNDLKDYEHSTQSGFSVSTTIDLGGTKTTTDSGGTSATTSMPSTGIQETPIKSNGISGQTTIGRTEDASRKEGITRATIGEGTVNIKDGTSIKGLNRDVAKHQETTYNKIERAKNYEAKIDNRVITGTIGLVTELTGITNDGLENNGFVRIGRDFKNAPSAVVETIKTTWQTTEQIFSSVVAIVDTVISEALTGTANAEEIKASADSC
jgi:filamentous hemagglutinin